MPTPIYHITHLNNLRSIVKQNGLWCEAERANQGIWYFCARVAESSRYIVRRCLEDQGRYDADLARHLSSLQAGTAAVGDFREESIEQ